MKFNSLKFNKGDCWSFKMKKGDSEENFTPRLHVGNVGLKWLISSNNELILRMFNILVGDP